MLYKGINKHQIVNLKFLNMNIALVRLASLYNIAFATNRTTADFIITSPLADDIEYKPIIPTAIEKYKNRFNN